MNGDSKAAVVQALAKLKPGDIESHFVRLGWERTRRMIGAQRVLRSKQGDELLIPQDVRSRDYARLVYEALRIVARPGESISDMLVQISMPASDVIKYQIKGFDSQFGSLSLEFASQAVEAMKDFLRFTAAGVETQQRQYTGLPDKAVYFSNRCRLGQTELGSFVFKFFCPVNPDGVPDDLLVGEPYGRRVVRACLENVSYITSEMALDQDEVPPVAMNLNVASALSKMLPASDFSSSIMEARFFSPADKRVPAVRLDGLSHARVDAVIRRLRVTTEFEIETLRGYITDLHMDPPTEDMVDRAITMQVVHRGTPRQLRLRLQQREYTNALRWHSEKREIMVQAVIDKRGKTWTVHEHIKPLKPVDHDEPRLFS